MASKSDNVGSSTATFIAPLSDAAERIPKMIATELEPRLVAYRADMASARDALFGMY